MTLNSKNDSDQTRIEELYLDRTPNEILLGRGNFAVSLNHFIYATPAGQRASSDFVALVIRISSKQQYRKKKRKKIHLEHCTLEQGLADFFHKEAECIL